MLGGLLVVNWAVLRYRVDRLSYAPHHDIRTWLPVSGLLVLAAASVALVAITLSVPPGPTRQHTRSSSGCLLLVAYSAAPPIALIPAVIATPKGTPVVPAVITALVLSGLGLVAAAIPGR